MKTTQISLRAASVALVLGGISAGWARPPAAPDAGLHSRGPRREWRSYGPPPAARMSGPRAPMWAGPAQRWAPRTGGPTGPWARFEQPMVGPPWMAARPWASRGRFGPPSMHGPDSYGPERRPRPGGPAQWRPSQPPSGPPMDRPCPPQPPSHGRPPEQARPSDEEQLFRLLDRNGDSALDRDEIAALIRKLHESRRDEQGRIPAREFFRAGRGPAAGPRDEHKPGPPGPRGPHAHGQRPGPREGAPSHPDVRPPAPPSPDRSAPPPAPAERGRRPPERGPRPSRA